ncbi:MAG: hypothetical protein KDN22_18260 [Verrucomicrobiae bacterium]|nr:hypothetical protein [Verrucomicrobiae bacterium]
MNASELFRPASIKKPQIVRLTARYAPRGALDFVRGASNRLSDTERDRIVESASGAGFEAIGWILRDLGSGALTVSDDLTRSLARLAHEFRPELVESLMATASQSEAQKLQEMLSDSIAIDTLLGGEARSTVRVDAKLLADVFVRQARGSEGVRDLDFLQYLTPQTRAHFLEVAQPQLFEAPSSLSTEAFVNGVIDTIAASERQTFLEAAVKGALEGHGNLLEAIGYCELMQEGDARTTASLKALSDWAAMDPASARSYAKSIDAENVQSALVQGIERGETSNIHP